MSASSAGEERPTVVVSPHLDDAVLSCGGWLAGHPATVVTVFAGVPAEDIPLPTWDRLTGAKSSAQRVRDRRGEDEHALGLVGAAAVHLDLLDGQYRTRAHDHDEAVELLRPLLAGAGEVWTAAGVGQHVDHLAARDAALAAMPDGVPAVLFADLPYSLVYGWPSWVDPASGGDHLDASPWLAAELVAGGLVPEALTPWPRQLRAEERDRKLSAMAAYASQLPALEAQSGGRLGDPAVMRHELAWRLQPGRPPVRAGWVPGAAGGWLPGDERPA
jgi:LmbE family N-acetylglucosaminyl deacetylase